MGDALRVFQSYAGPLGEINQLVRKNLKTRILTVLMAIASSSSSPTFAQQSKFDRILPSKESVIISLNTLNTILQKTDLTGEDILQIYYAERNVGRCVWGLSPKISDTALIHEMKMFGFLNDTSLMNKCILYICMHNDRFKVVDDTWKGEDNFWEPSRYWLLKAQSVYPDSIQTKKIEFDLDFNDLVRQFDIQDDFMGKTCEQCVKEELEMDGEELRKDYSEDDIRKWTPNCMEVRKQFDGRRKILLKKYDNAPFTKILKDIDVTTIVVFHGIVD